MNAIVKSETRAEIMENVLIRGDLGKLSVEERGQYYNAVCTSVGLNPLTKPFEYIVLNGKLRLYALKDCTDQLRSIHGISVTDLAESEREGVFVVKAKVANAQGRTDVSTGAVNVAGLKGENLANALMKAETKAKRRATLSICGLGLLDETEVEDIPDSAKSQAPRDSGPPRQAQPVVRQIEPPQETQRPEPKPTSEAPKTAGDGPHKITGGTYASWADSYIEAVGTAGDPSTVMAWIDANVTQLEKLGKGSPSDTARVKVATEKHMAFLRKTEPKADPITSGPQGALLDNMGGDTAPKPGKATSARAKAAKKAPDFEKDYDGWVKWNIDQIATAETPEAIETLFETIDGRWNDLFPADKDLFQGARREAEGRLE